MSDINATDRPLLSVSARPPSKAEIVRALKRLKNGKATGSGAFRLRYSKLILQPLQKYCSHFSFRSGKQQSSIRVEVRLSGEAALKDDLVLGDN